MLTEIILMNNNEAIQCLLMMVVAYRHFPPSFSPLPSRLPALSRHGVIFLNVTHAFASASQSVRPPGPGYGAGNGLFAWGKLAGMGYNARPVTQASCPSPTPRPVCLHCHAHHCHHSPLTTHWHNKCPNAMCANKTTTLPTV